MFVFLHDCDHCGYTEERVFTDSFTGMALCPGCLCKVIGSVTMSPGSEGDNLKEELEAAIPADSVREDA